jgi:hypothetical protein
MEFLCPSNGWLTSCRLRVESMQGDGDDTAANNLECKCSNGQVLLGDGEHWGDWNEWSSPCDQGIETIQTRVQEPQGSGDNTALNDVRFTCSALGG